MGELWLSTDRDGISDAQKHSMLMNIAQKSVGAVYARHTSLAASQLSGSVGIINSYHLYAGSSY